MPRRRDEPFLEVLTQFFVAAPWWVGPIVAALTFVLFAFVVPALAPAGLPTGSGNPGNQIMNNTVIHVIGAVSGRFAPIAAGVVLLMWLVSLVLKAKRHEILERQVDLESIRALSWRDFELLVGEYYRRKEYQVEERDGSSPDGGIDLTLRKDGRIVLVQCKHWKEFKVGVKPIRELLGVMTSLKAQDGIFVTSGASTKDATEFAKDNGIDLIDGEILVPMIRSVQASSRERSAVPSSTAAGAQKDLPASAMIGFGLYYVSQFGDQCSKYCDKVYPASGTSYLSKIGSRGYVRRATYYAWPIIYAASLINDLHIRKSSIRILDFDILGA